MAAPKGHKFAKGRPPGAPNKTTQQIREAYQVFVEGNIPNFQQWIDLVAQEDPHKALQLIIAISEYFVPKLARHEHTGEGGGPIETVEVIRFVKAEKNEIITTSSVPPKKLSTKPVAKVR